MARNILIISIFIAVIVIILSFVVMQNKLVLDGKIAEFDQFDKS